MTISLQENKAADLSLFDQFTGYASKATGSLRSLSLIRGLARLRNEVVSTHSFVAKELESTAGTAMSGLGLVRLPAVTKDAYDAIVGLGNDDGMSTERKTGIAIRDTMEAVTSWSNAGAFVSFNPALKQVASIADFASDSADFCLSVADYHKAALYEEDSFGEVKEAFAHTRKYNMLRIAKAVLSVAAAVFALMMLFTGIKLLPVVLAIILSLATTLVAIQRDLFKDQGKYKLIDMNALPS